MKKITILCIIYLLSGICAYAQFIYHVDHGDHGDPGDHEGGSFLKIIEHNLKGNGEHNLDRKGDSEKQLLDYINAPVEFFYNPFAEMPDNPRPSAFRIVRDSSANSYMLEYKAFKVTLVTVNDIIVSRSFAISDQLAEKMYKKMVSLIYNIRAKGTQKTILDGYEVTFRTVVEDEVWSLLIHIPTGNADKMFDLCKQICDDADAKKLDEAKYIKILDEFNFERTKPKD